MKTENNQHEVLYSWSYCQYLRRPLLLIQLWIPDDTIHLTNIFWKPTTCQHFVGHYKIKPEDNVGPDISEFGERSQENI